MPKMILKQGAVICEMSEDTGQLTMWRYFDDNGNPAVDKKGVPVPTPIIVHISEELLHKHADKLEPLPTRH